MVCDYCKKEGDAPITYGIRHYCSTECRDNDIEEGIRAEVKRRKERNKTLMEFD